MKKGAWFSLGALCVLVAGAATALAIYISKNGCCFCDYDDDDFDFDYDEDEDDGYCCSDEFCEEDCKEYTKTAPVKTEEEPAKPSEEVKESK